MIGYKNILLLFGLALMLWAQAAIALEVQPQNPRNITESANDNSAACSEDTVSTVDGTSLSFAGKPVNLLSGAETMMRADLNIGNAFPIIITRRYDSRSTYDSPVGYGWALNYDRRIYTYPDGSVTLRKECGWKKRFSWSVAGYINPAGDNGLLVMTENGGYTYTYKNGNKDIYDAQGKLIRRVDTNGNSAVIQYQAISREPLIGLLPYNLDQNSPLIVAYDYHIRKIEEKNNSEVLTGNWVEFNYDSTSGRLTSIQDNLGREVRYGYDSTGIGNLTSVSGPAGSAVYAYTDSRFIHILTDVDEGQGNYHNVYDSQARVQSQTHGTGSIAFSYVTSYGKTSTTTTIKDLNGNQMKDISNSNLIPTRTVEFGSQGKVSKVTDAYKNVFKYFINSNLTTTREEYWKNTSTYPVQTLVLQSATNYTYDSHGNIKTKIESSDWPASAKTTSYNYWYEVNAEATSATYHNVADEIMPSVVVPGANKVASYSYDNANGNLLAKTETGYLDPQTPYAYTTSYDYWPNGKLKTITNPLLQVTYYEYTNNNLSAVTLAYGTTNALTTTYADWDGFGNPQSVTDPNGNVTRYTYDATTGKVLTVLSHGDTNATQFFYVPNGCASCGGGSNRLDHIILPEGNRIDYGYDSQGNLNLIRDNAGNTINHSYDSERNRIKTQLKDASGVLKRTLNYIYDGLNRLQAVKNDSTLMFQYGYDLRKNLTSKTVPANLTTSYAYDPLDRLKTATQPGSIVTSYDYDTSNNITTVTDDNGHLTTYVFDDNGRVRQTISPDTGATAYSYDAAGNLISRSDAKGVTIAYEYDYLNRLTKIDYPDDADTIHAYDACTNGKGRLCSLTDASGSTSYEYSPKGELARETKIINSYTYITQYTYDQNGNVKTITYPSGRVITYNYTNDKVSGVLNNSTAIASNINYLPFGGRMAITYGNGISSNFGYDSKYRISSIVTGTYQNLTYTYDYNDNIKTITNNLDMSKNKSFTYDSVFNLLSAGTTTWTYDGVGNRLTERINGPTSTYAYFTENNRLQSVIGGLSLNFNYDSNGNMVYSNSRTFDYNQNQRLIRVIDSGTTTGEYVYNGNGQRTVKVVNGVVTIFHYDRYGRFIAESNSSGAVIAEYVYLNNAPLAKIEGANTYYYHNDHLATPQKMTDGTRAVVWSADYKPFGEATIIISTITNNLRFPGQYYDAETGLNYNYYRDYNPAIGRYIEADPLGMFIQVEHLFTYARNNPLIFTDELGLDPDCQYSISRGHMVCTNNGTTIHNSGGWVSGQGRCQNNPSPICLGQPNRGPIPPGNWNSTGRPAHRPATTTRRNLIPDPNNYSGMYMRGLDAPFQTHACPDPSNCSNGCIAQPNNNVLQNFNNMLTNHPNMPITVVP